MASNATKSVVITMHQAHRLKCVNVVAMAISLIMRARTPLNVEAEADQPNRTNESNVDSSMPVAHHHHHCTYDQLLI